MAGGRDLLGECNEDLARGDEARLYRHPVVADRAGGHGLAGGHAASLSRGGIDDEQATTLKALRWRVVTWLVVIELVLGQNLLGQVLALLQGSRA